MSAPFTRLVVDELPDDGTDYDPQEPGWRIHDWPEDCKAAYWIAGGMDEAEAKFIALAVNEKIERDRLALPPDSRGGR